ncbi:hypothetical protein BJX63DRAFT_115549 [Aspergillus granulosus]|uniref:DUF7708 domain-containing protein n=1 Tax=Aspergillus granulosus TaxID=176169 RepID=A0ABR4GTG5_9EURO
MSAKAVTPLPAIPRAAEDGQFPAIYWKRRFDIRHPSPNPTVATLDIEYNELAKAWKKLQDLLPLPDQVLFQERPQTSQDVYSLVRDIQSGWASHPQGRSLSRSTALCDTFMATLDAHTLPLTTLPSHQFYSSLLYAALQSIIKAAANYPRIMEGLMKVLVEVNQSICPTVDGDLLQLTQHSIPSIANFYSLTFFLLGELMDWYIRRFKCRLLQSLHEDVYLDFSGLISTIQSSARQFVNVSPGTMDLDDNDHANSQGTVQHTELILWEEARLSQIGRRNIERRFAGQNALTRLLIWEIQRSVNRRARLMETRGASLQQMRDTASQRLQAVGQQSEGTVCLTTAPGQDLLLPHTPSETSKNKYSRVELLLASTHLQDYFDSNLQIADYPPDVNVVVDDDVMEVLQQWTTEPHSQIIAVGGSPNPNVSNPALISACYANLALDAEMPVIAHFCVLPPTAKNGMTLFQQGLIALVYSLIRQLIEHLPPVANGTADRTIKGEQITVLDGTLASWKEVLSLVDILLGFAPPLLFCIIDGLDKLQHPSTDGYIRSLVRLFVSHTRKPPDSEAGRQDVLLKALFTVTGPLDSLVEALSENPLTLSESNNIITMAATDTPICTDVEIVIA